LPHTSTVVFTFRSWLQIVLLTYTIIRKAHLFFTFLTKCYTSFTLHYTTERDPISHSVTTFHIKPMTSVLKHTSSAIHHFATISHEMLNVSHSMSTWQRHNNICHCLDAYR